jgi:DnaJ-class molecular chaperone
MALAAMAGQMNANQAQQPQPQMQNSGQQMGGGYFQMESGDYLQQRLDEQQRQIEQLKRQQQQGQSNSGRLVNCHQCGGSGRTAPDGSPILNPALNQRPVPCQRCRGTGAISEPFPF